MQSYVSELREIITSIQDQAKYAGVSPDAYVPEDLATEFQIAKASHAMLSSASDDELSLFGIGVSELHLAVMASALDLRRDDLQSRLDVVEADSLMPKEAHSPLRDEIERMDREFEDFWKQYGFSPWLPALRERREMKLGLSYPRNMPIESILPDGEGQTTEFMASFPEQVHELAREIAAFGTSNPGLILLGVNDNGVPVGIKNMRSVKSRDNLQTRIEGISSNGIIPSLPLRVRFEVINHRRIAIVEVPKGPEPVYYTKTGVPYVRHGSLSRPALPQEVNELIRRHLERQSAS